MCDVRTLSRQCINSSHADSLHEAWSGLWLVHSSGRRIQYSNAHTAKTYFVFQFKEKLILEILTPCSLYITKHDLESAAMRVAM